MTNPGSHADGASEAHYESLHAIGIRDVATAAGVSTATVSRALRGLPRVSQPTRQKILEAAANLGYVASSAASELARGRGTRRATLPDQLKRVGPPASNTMKPTFVAPFEASDNPVLPSRGTIVIVNGPLSRAKHDAHAAPAPVDVEQLVHSVASAHGFTARVKSCSEADMLDTVRAAAASAAGIIINTGCPRPAPTGLHDALASASIPTVEIRLNHITQSSACMVVISGAGVYGYKLAIDYLGTAAS